jgi:two-component system osmolarity sensor histidine kinase EnvZ
MSATDPAFAPTNPSAAEEPLTSAQDTSIQDDPASDKDQDDWNLEEEMPHKRRRLSLFWYTFGLLLILLVISMLAGYWLLRTIDEEPRARENTNRIVSFVALAKAGLLAARFTPHSPEIHTFAMPNERIHLLPRAAGDRIQPFSDDLDQVHNLIAALRNRIGPDIQIAHRVNGQTGLWVGITVGNDKWWLLFDDVPFETDISGSVWLLWGVTIGLLIMVGAALFVRLINRPLDALVDAAVRVRRGDYASNLLNEDVPQTEVYAVNMHFNRMAEQLARVEQERAQMLAGISHDLRTPLARLRLEVEMGVPEEQTRDNMSADIQQVGDILNKFLDYARPSRIKLRPINLYELVRRCAQPFARRQDMLVNVEVPKHLYAMADRVELGRAIYNLLENANRYGQTPGTSFTKVRISAAINADQIKLRVRDYGPGVPHDQVGQLTRPFYRGDPARQNVAGTGLGLSIVVRSIESMGGQFRIRNASSGGLVASIRLQRTEKPQKNRAAQDGRNLPSEEDPDAAQTQPPS